MNIELLEKHPKAAKVVREYFLEKMIESLKEEGLPDDFKEHVRQQGITNERIVGLLDGQARSLFDVFDENDIYIHIGIFAPMIFKYQINDLLLGPIFRDVNKFKTRKEAEKAAIEESFQILENKL